MIIIFHTLHNNKNNLCDDIVTTKIWALKQQILEEEYILLFQYNRVKCLSINTTTLSRVLDDCKKHYTICCVLQQYTWFFLEYFKIRETIFRKI